MDITPSGDLLATGGTDPADCVVLRTSDYSPVTTLIGHRDWLFGNAWVSDRHLVTGSRDRAMALWTINPDENIGQPPTVQEYAYHGPQMKKKYEGKVRDVKYDRDLRLVVGLGTEGVVKLHDPNLDLRVLRTVRITLNFVNEYIIIWRWSLSFPRVVVYLHLKRTTGRY
jgi:WD repeat-containing protein 40A